MWVKQAKLLVEGIFKGGDNNDNDLINTQKYLLYIYMIYTYIYTYIYRF